MKLAEMTPDATADYWRDGFLFPIRVMSSNDATMYRDRFEQFEATWKAASLPRPFNDYLRYNTHVISPLACDLARRPTVLDQVEAILGPDLLLWSCEVIVKEPGTEHFLSMHQDLTYWGFGETSGQVTAWIALSPATVASGCMSFVAGSHARQIPHRDTYGDNNVLSRGQEVAVDVNPSEMTAVELNPGEMSLHHGLMFHGSGANLSDDRRIGVVIRYMRPEVTQRVGSRDYAMMVRGADRAGNFLHIAPPDAEFSHRALALYDEIAAAQEAALSDGADRDMSYDRTQKSQ